MESITENVVNSKKESNRIPEKLPFMLLLNYSIKLSYNGATTNIS